MTDYSEHAQQIRDAHTRQLEQMRARREYTPEAKAALASRIHSAGEDQMNELQRAYETERRNRYASLRKLFFAPGKEDGTDPASRSQSFRNAKTEAAKISDAKLMERTLAEANQEGDGLLVKALLLHAHESGMSTLVSGYLAEHRPDVAPQYDEMRTYSTEEDSPHSRFMRNAQFMLPTPTEIDRLDDYKIRQLAASELFSDDAA